MKTSADKPVRTRELAMIHIGAEQLGMDTRDPDPDSAYRSMLWTVGRVRSASKLDYAGRQRVLAHLKKKGFRPAPKRSKPQARLIRHLWNSLASSGVVQDKKGLDAWLVSNTRRYHAQQKGWQRPEFLPDEVAQNVVEQLKIWCNRTGVMWK